MKHFRFVAAAILVVAAAALAACSSSSTDKFIAGLTNFGRGVAAVDETLKQVNATIYANCASLVTVTNSINDLAGQCSKAAPYTSVANAVIENYCQTSGVQSAGIAQSVSVTATSVSAAKTTLSANKKACGAS